MLLPPLKFSEHAVNDIIRKFCPPLEKSRGTAPEFMFTTQESKINEMPTTIERVQKYDVDFEICRFH